MLNSYICALDIGSSKIAAAVAEVKRKHLKQIFFDSLPLKGVKNGVIVDSIELVNSLTKLMKNLKAKSGINIRFLSVNISGPDIITKHSRAISPLAERGNKVITVSDIQRVNEQARILGSCLEDEIIHLIPSGYTVDSKSNILNPLGLYSHRLEVDLYLICAKISSIQSLNRAINKSGYEIKDVFFSGLATSKAVFDKEFKEGLNLFCDIGADTTELLVFRSGRLCDIEILPVGGNDLTNEAQELLKLPFDLAEEIKMSYGIIGDALEIGQDKEILVKKDNLYKPIKQRLVSQIITSSAKSLCLKIKEAVDRKVSTYEVDNFITAGRTVLLEGFIEMLENTLEVPVKTGRITNQKALSVIKGNTDISGQKYLTYLTCLGIILSGLQEEPAGMLLPTSSSPKNLFLKALNRFKELYQEYF